MVARRLQRTRVWPLFPNAMTPMGCVRYSGSLVARHPGSSRQTSRMSHATAETRLARPRASADPPAEELVGADLGQYRLLELIGAGRHGPGVPGRAPDPRASGRHQAPAAIAVVQSQRGGPVLPRSPGRQSDSAPQHCRHHGLRRDGRRECVHRDWNCSRAGPCRSSIASMALSPYH